MINPVPENIQSILNASANLKVPKYQREYKWGTSEAGEFWEDLESYLDSPNDHLFLGNLIFDIHELQGKKIWIIDGQQRITTILILLIACRELAKRINAIKIANKIQEKICFEDSATGEFLGSRLTASESIRSVFDHLCKDDWDGVFPERLTNGKQVKRQSNRLKPIYSYFSNKISTFDQPKLSKLLTALYSSYIIRIDIEDEIEAFKIFERTNARGIDLEASDLLKNYLFSTLGNSVEEAWFRITELSDGTMLKMLKYFYVSKKGKISKSELYKQIKTYGRDISPKKLLDELEYFAYFYDAIRKADSATMKNYFVQIELTALIQDTEKYEDVYESIEGLRLFKITQIFPLISSAIACFIRNGQSRERKESNKLVSFFKKLEKYHFINNAICERIGNEVENIYAEYSKKYAESDNFDQISTDLYSALKLQLAQKDEFVSRFTDIGYQASSIPLISYIFDRFSNFKMASGHRIKIFNPDERVLRRNHNIEHFYPQNPLEGAGLPVITDEEKNNIGNLLCISFRTNGKLGNLTPENKYHKLKGNLASDIANIPYVNIFLDEYKDSMSNWNNEVILGRAKNLANDAYDNIWSFNN